MLVGCACGGVSLAGLGLGINHTWLRTLDTRRVRIPEIAGRRLNFDGTRP